MPVIRWKLEMDGRRYQVLVNHASGRGGTRVWVNGREIDAGGVRRGRKRIAFMLGRHASVLDFSMSGDEFRPLLMVDGRFVAPSAAAEEDSLLRPAEEDAR